MRICRFSFIFLSLTIALLGGVNAQCSLPFQLTNGQTADASQVMANLNALLNCVNNNNPGGPQNSVQVNNGATFGGVGPLANGQLVIGATGNAPQAAALSAGPGIIITNSPGNITIAAGGAGGAQYSWIRLVLFNNSGGNSFAWVKTVITDVNGVVPTFQSARSSQVYQNAVPANTFAANPSNWSSIDTTVNFFDAQFTSSFVPGSLSITAINDSVHYDDGPIDVLVLGSNDGVTFYSLGGVHFAPWTTPLQVQTVNLP